ncbi:MAG: PIG-L deacetylase family protein [Thermodesulfobacteriota bacterium]
MNPVFALIIAPHPDDAEIGAGGTIARWIREAKEVVYVVCTDGSKGSRDRSLTSAELAVIRQGEQLKAAETLGVTDVVFLNYHDQELEDTTEFRRDLVREIRRYRPEVVVTMDPYRRYIYHRDHRITGQAALDAVFPAARTHLSYPDLLAAGFAPHRVREMLFIGAEEINYRVDITDTFATKVKALKCHRSQYKQKEDSPSWFEWIRRRDQAMAEDESYDLAEAFYRVKIR